MTTTDLPTIHRERTMAESAIDREIARIRRALTLFSASGERHDVGDAPTGGPGAELAQRFGLSPFERDVVMLAASVELDGDVAERCRSILDDGDGRPTAGLALSCLPSPHWDAISADGPLRFWRLVTMSGPGLLTDRRVQIDERILNHVLGLTGIDQALLGCVDPISRAVKLYRSVEHQIERIAARLLEPDGSLDRPLLLGLDGDRDSARGAVARLTALVGATPVQVRLEALPAPGLALHELARAIDREWVLARRLPVLTGANPDPAAVTALVDELLCPLVLAANVDLPPDLSTSRRRHSESLAPAEPSERRQLLHRLLTPGDDMALCRAIDDVSERHWLSAEALHAMNQELVAPEDRGTGGESPSRRLYRLCRERSRVALDDLAHRVETRAGWADLVLPPGHLDVLHDIVRHVRQRARVYDSWGFADRTSRGMGITALFAGESGTGKTLAAEIIANELQLDLYRVDLSATISKYIGETEKNMARLFDAAEGSGAVLLFDEADALFGKRTEVQDSHDRYANLEVAYLLQRMETYRGLAVLTTNLRTNLDRAFVRRLRFVVQFPFPDEALRAEIWRRVFPAATPQENLDPQALARLTVPGGSIWSIALSAAFAAAEDDSAVTAEHVLGAARREYAKHDRTLTASELGAFR